MGIHRHGRKSIGIALMSGLGIALTGAAVTPATSGATPAVTGAAHNESDLAAFTKMRQHQEAAWARGDGKAYASIYSPDADLVNILGEHLHGRATIATKLQQYFNTQLKNTRLLEMDDKVRFITPTMAVIVRKSCVLYNQEKACRPDALSINTNVAVKQAGQWMITSFQNTLIRPRG
ncbi:SgcJ/EcaC family oxidoreductase [Sphaerisporangium sp. TRM90804]|uniref:SgcJ/EcaC family oxidoreductase n=1 Tax=Sphaerisporangium sp. TRM90804 TaxID=3031113 RepID=UPI00244A75CC|nr:SgcJ/EcaC family oxidoreductase [Sphaerisporangium sp. TRM90804]MDH2428257.1 SgcJ/EcaC family oxidoreductase [Sphaerisporangium sp. TRM90804]